MNQEVESIVWWNSLRHSGLLLDRKRLGDLYPAESPAIPWEIVDGLRRTLELGHSQTKGSSLELIDFVLTVVCRFGDGWKKGPQVETSWTRRDREGNALRPERLWTGPHGCILPVFIDKESKTLGLGKGRRVVGKVLGWMRSGSEKLAVLTNGRQWRFLHAGLDYDAWCESDSDLWFEDGAPSAQLHALVSLLDPRVWTPTKLNVKPPLLQAVEESRKGQADLSSSLGERVRLAVEKLIDAHQIAIDKHGIDIPPAELYRGAVRVVMRLVVVLFAEARGLLPVDNAVYYASYGLRGLQDDLRKLARAQRLSSSQSAWPRLLALFRLVYDGSAHPDLPVPGYGGELFQPGSLESTDGLRRAIWIFENACFKDDSHGVSDKVIGSILEHLTRTMERIRSGRGTITVPVPVDFSDLSSEYIGILYEGLLDYELKPVPEGDAVIILPIGNRPALPLSRLEAMTDAQLKELLAKFAKDSKAKASDSEEEAEEPEEAEEEEDGDAENEDEAIDDTSPAEEVSISDTGVSGLGERVTNFLRRMVEQGQLVAKPRGSITPEKQAAYRSDVEKKAIAFSRDAHFPGKRYLVRWGGTRKGSGAFYTRPGLSGPLIHRTLAPLAYIAPLNADGTENRDAMLSEWAPRKPEEILALKVCDIACGSGTFPVGALRFLTQALYDSVHFHARITQTSDHRTAVSFFGRADAGESIADEYLPCLPDDETYEARLRARLKRHVAERCIYGVDLDPLAVELCRLSLWVETLDQDLPFTFLNHKIKCGNSLVGCWYDRYQHYPVMAFAREAGDKNHSTSIHCTAGLETVKIDQFLKGQVIPDLTDTIQGQGQLFAEAPTEKPAELHHKIRGKLDSLHSLPLHASQERANLYLDILNDANFKNLRDSFDLWCSLWFWPVEAIDAAPLPSSFRVNSDEVKAIVRQCSQDHRFFHWELEFPDVFNEPQGGFDGIIGNPPWDIVKPNSKEFFSNLDPLFRIYGKQDALEAQRETFRRTTTDERRWLDYKARFKSFGNWMRFAGSPFGNRRSGTDQEGSRDLSFGRGNDGLHDAWAASRALVKSFAASDPEHPFLFQGGGDVNLYKCFLEMTMSLLKKGGRLGLILQSGIHTDSGTKLLRCRLRDKFSWEWCFGFTNRKKIFPSVGVRFDLLIAQKEGKTGEIRCSFMRQDVADWETGAAEILTFAYKKTYILEFSPLNESLMEIRHGSDLLVFSKIYGENCGILRSKAINAWDVGYHTEFHLTNDSVYFSNRRKLEESGYRLDIYGRWIKGGWSDSCLSKDSIPSADGAMFIEPSLVDIVHSRIKKRKTGSRRSEWASVEHKAVAVSLYQGVMLWQFDFRYKSDVAGRGKAKWQPNSSRATFPVGYFLIPIDFLPAGTLPRIGIRDVGNNSMRRSLAPALLPPFPHSNKVPILAPSQGSKLSFLACLGSFVMDMALRLKISEATLNKFYLDELPIPPSDSPWWTPALDRFILGLCGTSPWFVCEWIDAVPENLRADHTWRSWWVKSAAENQRRRAVIDAVVAHAYDLSEADLRWILADCFHPSEFYRNRETRQQLDPKGFWRVDEDLPAPIRHTTLCLAAFIELGSLIEQGNSIPEAVNAMTGIEPDQGWCMSDEALAIFSDMGLNVETEYPKQTPAESWLEVEVHQKQLFKTPLWTGVLSKREAEEIQPETFE